MLEYLTAIPKYVGNAARNIWGALNSDYSIRKRQGRLEILEPNKSLIKNRGLRKRQKLAKQFQLDARIAGTDVALEDFEDVVGLIEIIDDCDPSGYRGH